MSFLFHSNDVYHKVNQAKAQKTQKTSKNCPKTWFNTYDLHTPSKLQNEACLAPQRQFLIYILSHPRKGHVDHELPLFMVQPYDLHKVFWKLCCFNFVFAFVVLLLCSFFLFFLLLLFLFYFVVGLLLLLLFILLYWLLLWLLLLVVAFLFLLLFCYCCLPQNTKRQ